MKNTKMTGRVSTRRSLRQESSVKNQESSGFSGAGASSNDGAGGFFDSLDILATIATQELKSKDKVRLEFLLGFINTNWKGLKLH